jgi:UDP:flavonoid glycosyltransferase YjiC (YdhE family)
VAGKIVLSNVGTLGDLHPFIAIALQLRERGYDAVIATSPDFRDNVVSEGIAFPARIARLGVGRWIGLNQYSLSRVASELATLLGRPAYRSRAAAIGRDVGREDGPEAAVRVVDRLLIQAAGRA